MIKKLRRKFVIINMSLVAVILCVVLGMFCFTRIHAFRAESEIAMRQMLTAHAQRSRRKMTRNLSLQVLISVQADAIRHLTRPRFFWSLLMKTTRSRTPTPAAPIP